MSGKGPSGKGGKQPADPRLSQLFGKYRIVRHLGEGGMGIVYEAEDTLLKRRVAIKFLPDELLGRDKAVERFMQEAQALARLAHPNITAIYDIGKEAQCCYMVMELLLPQSAGSYLKTKGRFAWSDATRIVADCCSALIAAHEADIVHRDIKPHNILFCPRTGCAKLVDFGLIKELAKDDQHLTQSGMVVGTPMYMSPEQASSKPLDARSDIYSLGATYYALLAGRPPFEADGTPQLLLKQAIEPLPDPRLLAPEIPEACIRVLVRATQKAPKSRYASAKELLADLEQALAGQPRRDFRQLLGPPPAAVAAVAAAPASSIGSERTTHDKDGKPTTPTPVLPPPSTRRGALAILGIAGGMITLGGVGWLAGTRQRSRRRPTRPPASPATLAAPIAASPSEPIRVGILFSLSGSRTVSERPIRDAILLALEELNARGGVLGRPVEPIERNGESDGTDPDPFRSHAERLISKDKVAVVFGTYTTSSRKAVKAVVEKHDHLLVFPGHHEGLEESPNILYTGAIPNQEVLPAVRYCLEKLATKRFFLIGSDALGPHIVNLMIRDELKSQGAQVVGEHYSLPRELAFGSVVKQLNRLKPELIVNTLFGDSNIAFFRTLRGEGITPAKLPTLSLNISENELGQFSGIDMSGDYLAVSYLHAVPRPENQRFISSFRKKYGEDSRISDAMEAAYVGVHLWAEAAKNAQSVEATKVRAALRNLSLEGPAAPVRVDPSNNHAWKMFRLGQIGPQNTVQLIASSEQLLPPIPFPGPRTRVEWDATIKHLTGEWGGSYGNQKKANLSKAIDLR